MGILKRAIAKDASVVASAVDATDIVAEIERIHKTSAVVTAALGRLSIAACMMGYDLKNEKDTVTLRVKGGGPAGMLVAVADSHGNVKADVDQPVVELPLNAKGKLDVGGAVGTDGTLSVVKDLGMKEPYVGVVPLVSGEIAEDVAQYFATSEQTPTVCGLGVLVNPDLTVNVAGGFLIEVLPFASDACIDTIENNLKNLPPVTDNDVSGHDTGSDRTASAGWSGTESAGRGRSEISVRLQPGANRAGTESTGKYGAFQAGRRGRTDYSELPFLWQGIQVHAG